MGRQQQHQQEQQHSLTSKAAHFVSDLTTVLLNPISDKPSNRNPHPPPSEDVTEPKRSVLESITEEDSKDLVDGPNTTSFTAFLYSLLVPAESGSDSNIDVTNEDKPEMAEPATDPTVKESDKKRNLISRATQSLGRVINEAARLGGYRNQASEGKGNSDRYDSKDVVHEGIAMQTLKESVPITLKESVPTVTLPEISEPSLLLSEKTRAALYVALPALVQGRKWVLLYSTWRHGTSLSNLYRRSVLCPGLSLLVVGDRKGAVFGGLVEAPLRPTNKKYQGTNSTFVFTSTQGNPVIYRPTGVNRYFTLCSPNFLALGGGNHFALYLDAELLSGSSSASETYGNSCLAHTKDFDVKEIELWGFVYPSKYEEMISLLRTEPSGICTW